MDLRQLQYFVRVAELGSLTKASVALGVAQPVLSRHIRELEAELGVALLARTGRGVAITVPGERFLVRAKEITAGVTQAGEEMRALRGRPAGPVSIAMAPSVGGLLWVPLVTRVQAAHPDVQLQLHEGYSGDVVEWLVSGRVDIGVLYEPHLASQLKPEFLIRERLYAVGTPDALAAGTESIDFRDVAALPLVLPGRNHAIRRLLEQAAAKLDMPLNVQLEVNAYPAIKQLVIAGRGYTVLPVASVLPELHAGQLAIAEITGPSLSQTVGLCTSTHHQPSVAARTVASIIRELVEGYVASGRWPAWHGDGDESRPAPDA
jgi:LysR family nitrogen assimilation transcriptional regulator